MKRNISPDPRNPFVELQVRNDHNMNGDFDSSHSDKKSQASRPVPGDPGFHKSNSSDKDFEFDMLPYVSHGKNEGSGLSGAVFNLSTTVIGAGIMALPATMKVLGIIFGTFLIIVMGLLAEVSIELLVRYSVESNATTYGEVVQNALGKQAKLVSEICIILNNGGVLVVYLIIMGDVMSGSLHHMGVFDQWWGHGFWDHRKLLILLVLVIFLAPLCALDRIESLSLTSAASVVLAVVFIVVTFIVAFIKLVEGKLGTPRWTPDLSSIDAVMDFLVVIPVMTNAYVSHFNVPPIYNELEGKSPEKMNQVGRITTVLCIFLYTSTAISGYLIFANDTESDVLTNFDKDLGIPFSTALNYFVRISYIIHLILVFPVINFSLRQTVDTLLFEGAPPLTESRNRCLALTGALLLILYIGSTTIPNIWTAFKFTGATTAVSLGFTFPSLIALKLSKQGTSLSPSERVLCWFMLIFAILVTIVGVIANIYHTSS